MDRQGIGGMIMTYEPVKRGLDVLGALFLSLLLLPLLLLLALCVRLDSKGPVLFLQPRLGRGGGVFTIYKFRTMVEGAEQMGRGIRVQEDDVRITRLGNFLRRSSLDELPQLLNILRGEMSFVGPRPPVPYHPRPYCAYTEEEKKRFTVRPGITGLAQVELRNGGDWDQRIAMDRIYVEKMSLFLDLRILLRTFRAVLSTRNIYRRE